MPYALLPHSSQCRLSPFGTVFSPLTLGRAPEDSPQEELEPTGAPSPHAPLPASWDRLPTQPVHPTARDGDAPPPGPRAGHPQAEHPCLGTILLQMLCWARLPIGRILLQSVQSQWFW